MKPKKGSALKIISSMLGVILILISVYYLINENLVYGSIFGIIGVLIVALSLMVYKK